MKRSLAIFIILSLMVAICSCSKTSVSEGADVTLTFVCGDKDISVTLEDMEYIHSLFKKHGGYFPCI